MTPKSKLSRKFILAHMSIFVSIVLPVVYHRLGLADNVTMAVLAIIGGSTVGYSAMNVMAKKFDPND